MLSEFRIESVNRMRARDITELIDSRSDQFDPPRLLRDTAAKIASIQNRDKPFLLQPIIYTFAADHGIAREGFCKHPQSLSAQTMLQHTSGASALNVFSRQQRIELRLIDAGLIADVHHPKVIRRRLAAGTENFAHQDAMSAKELERALRHGRDLIKSRRSKVSNLLGIGLFGVGSELAALMLLSLLTRSELAPFLSDHPAVRQASMEKMLPVFEKRLQQLSSVSNPLDAFRRIAGFEMAMALGAILQACEQKLCVLVEGLVGSLVAYSATLVFPQVRDYLMVAQLTHSFADRKLAELLQTEPLNRFDSSISDGSGIALSYPLVQAACSFLNEALMSEQSPPKTTLTPEHLH